MSRIRNPERENAENLKADKQKYVLRNLTFWVETIRSHFGVKYVDYGTDLKVVEKAVKEETSGPGQLLGYTEVTRELAYFGSTTRPGVRCHDADWPWRSWEPRKSWTKEATQRTDWHIYIAGKISVSAIFHRFTKSTWSCFASVTKFSRNFLCIDRYPKSCPGPLVSSLTVYFLQLFRSVS